jgi:hypothetical protein
VAVDPSACPILQGCSTNRPQQQDDPSPKHWAQERDYDNQSKPFFHTALYHARPKTQQPNFLPPRLIYARPIINNRPVHNCRIQLARRI